MRLRQYWHTTCVRIRSHEGRSALIIALDNEANAGKVLQATIALANALDIPVTAEGIETDEQAAIVRLSGCDELQGYLFSRPLTAEKLTASYFPARQSDVTVAAS
ncbi:EAL domain-containing protein [Pararhizobium qamdonense]|uniref:EAL domain-containing protein n=1 Tax=Pararhizobium qamdonense TaxID=3031126 RepID=UPI002E1B97EA